MISIGFVLPRASTKCFERAAQSFDKTLPTCRITAVASALNSTQTDRQTDRKQLTVLTKLHRTLKLSLTRFRLQCFYKTLLKTQTCKIDVVPKRLFCPTLYEKRNVVLRCFHTLPSNDGTAIQPRRKERSSAQFRWRP